MADVSRAGAVAAAAAAGLRSVDEDDIVLDDGVQPDEAGADSDGSDSSGGDSSGRAEDPWAPVQTRAAPYGSRREARERALSLLYEADAKNVTPAAILAEIPVEPPAFVISLVAGVGEHRHHIDELMARYASDWTIERMPVVDRMLVRMATFELLCRPDVPTGVVISEAVELAKRYSTDESGRFVNGLLASISAELRPTATS